jgi:hypothetical protein
VSAREKSRALFFFIAIARALLLSLRFAGNRVPGDYYKTVSMGVNS